MRNLFFSILICIASIPVAFSQFRNLPNASYFKDQALFSDSLFAPIFPVSDRQVNRYRFLQDTLKRYTTLGVFLFQRELIEVHKKEGSLWITPLLDIQGGIERGDTSLRQFLNVRGVRLEALLGKRLFVSTSVYENQAFLPLYVRTYANQRGEFYPNNSDSSYTQINAMIPNGARTKPFKTGGFDYAYATGLVRWDATKWLSISGGNQPLFVGSGYRSLIFNDNTAPSMFGRLALTLGKSIDYQVVRMQGMNLLRLPYVSNGEALYERKGISITSLYFKIGKKMRIGLVETAVWARGDSLQKQPVEGAFYLPIPGAGTLQQYLNNKSNALLTLDLHYKPLSWLGIYAQTGLTLPTKKSEVLQIGLRLWPMKNAHWLIQTEFNHTGKHAYEHSNPRLHFSSYNLPLGHIMGNGVDECLIRIRGEWKKVFFLIHTSYYFNQLQSRTQLLPVYQMMNYAQQEVFFGQIELGYRLNRTYGFELFGSTQFRTASGKNEQGMWINLGIRTQLNNRYFEF
jgi:hypothetical protein